MLNNNTHQKNPNQEQRRYGRWMFALMWVGVIVLLTIYFNDYLAKRYNPNQSINTNQSSNEVVLQRNFQGHYVATGLINNKETVFLLDTGATQVAIPEELAKQLNLNFGRQSKVTTANGVAHVYDTHLDSIRLGGIEINDIPAVIMPSFQSDTVLLGMSFLRHVEFTQRKDTLILRY